MRSGMPPRSRWRFHGAAALVLTAGLTAAAQTPPGSQAPSADDHPALPAGPGRELAIRVCSQCHEPEMVVDHRLDAAGWKTMVDQMAAQGATATEEEFDQVVQYLAKVFPATR